MSPPRRVLLVGHHLGLVEEHDAYVVRAFRSLGWAVVTFDVQATTFVPAWLRRGMTQRLRGRWSPRRWAPIARLDAGRSNRRFLACLARVRPELVIVLRGERLDAAAVAAARAQGAVVVNWLGDDPERFLPAAVIPAYDAWFITDPAWQQALAQRGARAVHVLPFACDPELHAPVALEMAARQRWASRACFVGTYSPMREQLLAHIADLGLGIWGPDWDRASEARVQACVRGARLLQRREWVQTYSAADLVIGLAPDQGQHFVSMRVWEALAVGRCLVAQWREDMDRYFRGLVTVFHDAAELRAVCQRLLQAPEERRRLAAQGRAHVLAQHTYVHRVQELLQMVQTLTAQRAPT